MQDNAGKTTLLYRLKVRKTWNGGHTMEWYEASGTRADDLIYRSVKS